LGKNVFWWITKLEGYFHMVAFDEKMEAVMVALESDALGWF